ncbi:tetratricopeptide repeat protein [Fictibacillus iocasae]|uniref:Tetratricopeptide repeat protein n=1 Tax=Fictibacillus iocasae TaxID=2715437 RepID=A0ABW2NMV7_9BACL
MEKMNEAITLIDRGFVKEGMELLAAAEKKAGDDDKLGLAEIYLSYGHLESAVTLLKELSDKYPDAEEIQLLLAECYMEEGQEEEALTCLLNVSEGAEGYTRSLLLQADIYEAQGLLEVAERKLTEAVEADPHEPVLSFAFGDFYLRTGSFPEAAIQLAKAREGGMEDSELKLAEALSRTGKFEESLVLYEEGLAIKKELYTLFGYGVTSLKAGEYKKAIAALEELKDMDPDYSTLYPFLSYAYEQEGALEEALQAAKDGLQRDEYNENIYMQAARLSYKLKNSEKGEHYVREALALNPEKLELLVDLGFQLLKEERYLELVSLYGSVDQDEDTIPVIDWHLASAYKELEEYDKARVYFGKAAAGLGEDPEFLEEYAYFLLEEGEQKIAVALFEKLLISSPDLTEVEETLRRLKEF